MAHKPNGNGNGKKTKPGWPKYGVLTKSPAVAATWLHAATGESVGLSHVSDDSAAADQAAAEIVAAGGDAVAVGLHARKPRKIKVPKK